MRGRGDLPADFLADRPQLSADLIKRLTDQDSLAFANQNTYEQVTSNQNDFILREGFLHRLETDASHEFTGFANVRPGRFVGIVNFGSNDIILPNENTGSVANNRIITGSGSYLRIATKRNALLLYDSATARWRVVGGSAPTGPRVLSSIFSNAGNAAGSGDTDLHSYTVPANTLATDGDFIAGRMAVTFANNANNKRFRVLFGGTAIFDTASTAALSNISGDFTSTIMRIDSDSVRVIISFNANSSVFTSVAVYTQIDSLSFTGGLILKAVGNGVAADDVVQRMTTVEWHPVN